MLHDQRGNAGAVADSDCWLIVTDLDGTLFDHSLRISLRVREVLARAQAAGHAVTLATGRMYRATLPVADTLKIDQPLICYQGALVQHGQRVIHHLALPLETARDAIRFAAGRAIHLNVYVDDRLFVAESTEEARFYGSLSPNVEIEVVGDLFAFLHAEPTKLVFIQSEDATTRFLGEAVARWGQDAQVVRSHGQFIELTNRAASKGVALLHLAEALGIPRERTLAIGDNLNDLTMIEAAGIGVAMGNALPALKAAADWVAPSLWEDGVAATVERFVLADGRQP